MGVQGFLLPPINPQINNGSHNSRLLIPNGRGSQTSAMYQLLAVLYHIFSFMRQVNLLELGDPFEFSYTKFHFQMRKVKPRDEK